MDNLFKKIWESLKKTAQEELQDLSYMEIITATSEKVDGHIDNKGWDILDSLRRGNPPSEYDIVNEGEVEIKKEDMLTLSNTEILARTRIELDGDIMTILKDKKGESVKMSEDAMELHKLGMDISVKNWHYFLQFVLEMTMTIGMIVGNVDESKYLKFSKAAKR